MHATAFFDAMNEAYLDELGGRPALVHSYEFGCGTMRLEMSDPALEAIFTPAISHLNANRPNDRPDLTVRVWQSGRSGRLLPGAPWRLDKPLVRGELPVDPSSTLVTSFTIDSGVLYVFCPSRNEAVVWVRDAEKLPYWERAAPMRPLIGWWAEESGCQLVHGSAVGDHGRAVLLSARGGSGKSTTALACLQAGMQYLGDDYVLIRPGGRPQACSVYNSAKLFPSNLRMLLPAFGPHATRDGEPSADKQVILLSETFADSLARTLELGAVVIPHVSDDGSVWIERTSPARALQALAPTTLFQLPGAGRTALMKMARLAKSVPAYSLAVGPDLERVVGLIRTIASARQDKLAESRP